MAENEQTQQNQNQAVGEGLVPSQAGELTTIKAQLEQEKTAKATLEEAMAGKDSRIAELETAVNEAKAEAQTLSEAKGKELEASAAELATTKEARDQAVTKYLNMAKALNPNIPEGIIGGETIAEIDLSIDKGKAIVEAVKKAMEAEAAATRVPAGAPTRGAISTEGMSPKEKIAYAIQPGSQR